MKFKIEKISNMIFITSDESEFTEKKLANATRKLQECYNGKVEFIKMF